MITISLCMIVKNEEFTLGRCLESVKGIPDEIIVVDTGSCDETKEVAGKYNAKIYDFKWMDDFAAARNFSFSKATMDYILWLDADDEILEEDRKKFLTLKQEMDDGIDIVLMRYNISTDEQGNTSLSLYRERLLKRNSNPIWKGVVHECIPINGETLYSEICITHAKRRGGSDRNLKILRKAIQQGIEALDVRNSFYMGKELFGIGEYEEGLKYYRCLIELENYPQPYCLEACLDICRYYMMKNKKDKVLETLFKTFEHDAPRAEVCCFIASFYREIGDYKKAIAWYETALALEKPNPRMEYVLHDFWGYIPCIELCHCFFQTGNISKAIEYNEMAEQYKSNDPGIAQNKEFFSNLLAALSQEENFERYMNMT